MVERFRSLKIILLGEKEIGKSSFRQVFIKNARINYVMSIPVDFALVEKEIVHQNENMSVTIQIWDFIKLEYAHLKECPPHQSFLKSTNAGIIVFDVSNIESFQKIAPYISLLFEVNKAVLPIYVVGTKADLRESTTCVSTSEISELISKLEKEYPDANIKYSETSIFSQSVEKDVENIFNSLLSSI